MDWRPLSSIQHALSANPGEGFRPTRVRQQTHTCGRGRMVIASEQADLVEHDILVWHWCKLHGGGLRAERRDADPRQQADWLASGCDCAVHLYFDDLFPRSL